MAAPIGECVCRLCGDQLPVKYRRMIFSPAFKVFEQLAEVLEYRPRETDGLSPYLCYGCFNKLNKLEKIDFDLGNKLQRLTSEKSCLLTDLRIKFTLFNPGRTPVTTGISLDSVCLVGNVNSFTPTKIHASLRTKRATIHTPTPRKSKVHQITTENDRDGNILQEETWSVFPP